MNISEFKEFKEANKAQGKLEFGQIPALELGDGTMLV